MPARPERLVEATIQEDAADAKRRQWRNSGTRSRRLRSRQAGPAAAQPGRIDGAHGGLQASRVRPGARPLDGTRLRRSFGT